MANNWCADHKRYYAHAKKLSSQECLRVYYFEAEIPMETEQLTLPINRLFRRCNSRALGGLSCRSNFVSSFACALLVRYYPGPPSFLRLILQVGVLQFTRCKLSGFLGIRRCPMTT